MPTLSSEKDPADPVMDAVRRARDYAPFLANLLDRGGDVSSDTLAQPVPIGLDQPTSRALRLARRQLALRVAVGDLAGVLDLTAVTRRLTDFADTALDCAIRTAMIERTPDATPAGFVAIALGKQGSCELNYSSDIDPIFLFDPEMLPRRSNEDPIDAAVRIGRRVIELLQARDADGYVLRVDLRLRRPRASASADARSRLTRP